MKMKSIENPFLPLKGYSAMMLFGLLLTRNKHKVTERTIRHESIHARQMWELLVVGFYVWYLVEWAIRLFIKGNAYRNLSFEREAYANQDDTAYLDTRRIFSFIKYLFNNPLNLD
jgi:hypothetical protein